PSGYQAVPKPSLCFAVGKRRLPMTDGKRQERDVELSARNQLKGTVKGVKSGSVMAEVTVSVEAGMMTAAITDASRERMNLKDGDEVTIVIKSTEVMIAK